jgi:pilus assembly protein CpaB
MNRRVLLVVLAVVLALTGTSVVYIYVKHADKRALADTRAAHILVVQTQIPAGTAWSDVIKGGYLKRETVPETSAPSDALADTTADVGKNEVATAVIQPGQVVERPMFGQQPAAVTGVLAIPRGMIAISVSVAGNADVAGYVQPNSQVAIFTTFKLSSDAAKNLTKDAVGGTDLMVTKLLLTKVTVIATSAAAPTDSVPRAGSSGSGGGSVLLTLALSQQDAQRLILAQQTGQLYLGLLSGTSNTSTNDGGVTNIGRVAPAPIFLK